MKIKNRILIALIVVLVILTITFIFASNTNKVKEYNKNLNKITIKDLDGKIEYEYTLLSNECDSDMRFCNATLKTDFKKTGKLFDSIDFKRIIDNQLFNGKVRWYKIYVNTLGEKIYVDDYGFIGTGTFTPNGTEIMNYTLIGNHKEDAPEWTEYNNQEFNNKKKTWLIKAEKRPSWVIDWILNVVGGIPLIEWATWGNISGGDDAEITLNNPINNSKSISSNNAFNYYINITGGSSIINYSLYTDEDGTWSQYNVTVGASPENLTEAHGWTETVLSAGNSINGGMKFYVNRSTKLTSVKKMSLVTAINSRLLNGAKGMLATSAFVGDIAYYNYDLVAGNYYYIVADSYGSLYNAYHNSSVTYPIVGEYITWNNSYSPAINQDEYTTTWNIESINVTNKNPTNLNVTINRTIQRDINWTGHSCDSDSVCGFSEENRTLLLDIPNFTIISPPASLTSATFTLNATFDSIADLVNCSYNITKGASTEVAETLINCLQFNDSITLSGEGTYVINLWANQSGDLSNSTNFTIVYAIPVVTPPGGGGGASVIIGATGWIMETSPDQARYDINMPEGTTRTLDVTFENIGESQREITLSCVDVTGLICNYVSFEDDTFSLPLLKEVKTSKDFDISLPIEIESGDYEFNIVGTDENSNQLSVSVFLGVGKQGLFLTAFSKIPLKTRGGFPYFIIFFGSLIVTLIGLQIVIPKSLEIKPFIVGISTFLVPVVLLFLI